MVIVKVFDNSDKAALTEAHLNNNEKQGKKLFAKAVFTFFATNELRIIVVYNIQKMEASNGRKTLSQIVFYIPNLITGFRLVLIYLALILYLSAPQQSCSLIMLSIILDYVDGIVARSNSQCSFFGDTFDWIVDISSSTVVYFWWSTLEPTLLLFIFTLLALEVISMVVDIIAKSHGYSPNLKNDGWSTIILKYTMNCEKRGYNCIGLGFWNQIFHYFCIISRILFLQTSSQLWNYLFFLTLPMSISYVWMNIAYAKNIGDRWNEMYQNNQAKVMFIEQ